VFGTAKTGHGMKKLSVWYSRFEHSKEIVFYTFLITMVPPTDNATIKSIVHIAAKPSDLFPPPDTSLL
jgi:hypothetical protein